MEGTFLCCLEGQMSAAHAKIVSVYLYRYLNVLLLLSVLNNPIQEKVGEFSYSEKQQRNIHKPMIKKADLFTEATIYVKSSTVKWKQMTILLPCYCYYCYCLMIEHLRRIGHYLDNLDKRLRVSDVLCIPVAAGLRCCTIWLII